MSQATRHQLTVNGTCLDFRVVRTQQRQRTIALQLQPDGRLVVRAPVKTPLAKIHHAVRQKAEWIQRHRMPGLDSIPYPNPQKELVTGESIYFLGQQYRLRIEASGGEDRVALQGQFLIVWAATRKIPSRQEVRNRLRSWFQEQARSFLPARVTRWLRKLGLKSPRAILISNQERRWASCSARTDLRFNWRLMGAPVSLVDYVIVHELSHLKWPNHSNSFWKELRRVMPDMATREQQLTTQGPLWSF